LIRLIILGALVYFGLKAVKRLFLSGVVSNRESGGNAVSKVDDIMIKDPYCQSYFPKRNGIRLHFNGEDLFFCSPECRDNFLKEKEHS
jgi:YHS domain-containing protein